MTKPFAPIMGAKPDTLLRMAKDAIERSLLLSLCLSVAGARQGKGSYAVCF